MNTNRLADDDFVDVVELIPVLVRVEGVAVERLELGPPRDGHVQRLGRVEALQIEQIEVVLVQQVGNQLVTEPVENAHLRQVHVPPLVGRAIHVPVRPLAERLLVVEPVRHGLILMVVQFHLDRLQRIHVEDEIASETTLEMYETSLSRPFRENNSAEKTSYLSDVQRLYDPGHRVTERDGAGDVIDDAAIPDLLPRKRHVLQELEDGVRNVLERSQIHPLVVPELARAHVAVVLDHATDRFRRHHRLRRCCVSELALLAV
eukprot:gene143-gene222